MKTAKSKQNQDLIFETIIMEATRRANEAGDKWLTERLKDSGYIGVFDGNTLVGKMLDCCGIVFIKVTDKRTAFYKWGKENFGWGVSIEIPFKYNQRQEQGLQEACCYAIANYLEQCGLSGFRVYSRID